MVRSDVGGEGLKKQTIEGGFDCGERVSVYVPRVRRVEATSSSAVFARDSRRAGGVGRVGWDGPQRRGRPLGNRAKCKGL